jgi:arylformamidase
MLNVSEIWDITLPLRDGMPVYPGDPEVAVAAHCSLAQGQGCNVLALRLGTHSGTHVDAPRHFLAAGQTVDRLPWAALLGPARLAQAPAGESVGADFIRSLRLQPGSRLLLRTRPAGERPPAEFPAAWPALTGEAADELARAGVLLLGLDTPSVDAFHAPEPVVHRALLGAGLALLENADLSAPPEGEYTLICLPLRVAEADGAPCRALLVR